MMDTLAAILNNGLIAIARGIYGDKLEKSVGALNRGGINAVEVTFEQGKEAGRTFEAISLLKERFGGSMAIGAGTVLNMEQLELAHKAGASYVVSPNTNVEIIAETKRLGLISIPGAMTPTEIVAAHEAGADIVKVFPAGMLGIEYFKALRAPLAHIRLAAVAGITPKNIAYFAAAGACAYGISSGLFDKKLIETGQYHELELIAADYIRRATEKV